MLRLNLFTSLLSITTHLLQGCIGLHRHKKTAQPPRTNSNREKVIEKQTNETAANTPTHAKQPSASYLNVLLFFLEHRSFLVVNDTCIQQLLCYCKSKSNYEHMYRLKSPSFRGQILCFRRATPTWTQLEGNWHVPALLSTTWCHTKRFWRASPQTFMNCCRRARSLPAKTDHQAASV